MATRMDFNLPAAGEATGISIFMASTKAISSPLPTLAPASTGSAQTRPATSVTTLISGIPPSGDSHCTQSRFGYVHYEGRAPQAFCCGSRLPEVACSASGILFRNPEWEPSHGAALGAAE